MLDKCEVKEQKVQHSLSIRKTTSVQNLAEVLGESYMRIMHYMGEIGECPTGAPYTAYFNMDMQNLEVEIGFPVATKLPEKGDIKPSEIPAGKYASCIHTGPYNEMEPSYDALTKWVDNNGYKPSGIAYEFYLNDPGDTPPDKLQTQILFLLK
ncbi:MAG: GyrI-like domain-containing protein [Promethearchaeia archaeon]